MGRVSGLQHEDHLIEARFRPLFYLTADRVRISSERHSIGQKLIVRTGAEFCNNRLLAACRREPDTIEFGVIVSIVPARGCAGDVLADTIVFMAARQRERGHVLIRRLADELLRVSGAYRLPICPDGGSGLGDTIARDPDYSNALFCRIFVGAEI